jgi:hypothetical protein
MGQHQDQPSIKSVGVLGVGKLASCDSSPVQRNDNIGFSASHPFLTGLEILELLSRDSCGILMKQKCFKH